MRKEDYFIGVDTINSLKNMGLSTAEHGVFIKLVNAAWLSSSQYELPGCYDEIASIIGDSPEVITATMDKLTGGKKPIFSSVINIEDLSTVIICQFLACQIRTHHKWLAEQASIIRKKEAIAKKGSLKYRIAAEKDADLKYGNLMPEHRDLSVFKNWFPTNRFDSQGQVFYINKDIRNEIKKSHPFIDMDEHLADMFKWLVNNPIRRKTVATMSFFIFSWLDRVDCNNDDLDTGSSFEDMEKELDALLGAMK
jgi:hypothetical protein